MKEINYISLAPSGLLDPVKTFECGQCFRWDADAGGVYTGVVGKRVLRVKEEDGLVLCSAPNEDLEYWTGYFDLDNDYTAANALFAENEYLKICADYGAGIRILRQEPWEALCSFIISQCNNIPRIKGVVLRLCQSFGEELEEGVFSFPGAEVIAPLSESDLAPLRSGYRAGYILNAARAVAEGRLDFDELAVMDAGEAFSQICALKGVGKKVANCFMLYGLHRMDRFPVDVWMKRALKEHFPSDFDPASLGEYSGLAQQYIFYHAREEEGKAK